MKSILALLAGPLIVALLVACAPQATQTPLQPPPGATPSAPAPAPLPSPKPPVTTPAPSPQAGQPKSGGTLIYWSRTESAGFDLHRKPSYAPFFAAPVFNNLVTFDQNKPDLVAENIVPDLAERWESSTDGKTITFFLRKGVKWHDGQPFTADDVVYNLEKMVDPKRSTIVSNLSAFERVEKLDDYSVRVQLKQPSPSFLNTLAGPFGAMQPKHRASIDHRKTDFLVGTGPFKFKSYTSGVVYEYVKNPDYFKKGLPYLDGLRISIVPDRSAQLDAFVSKRVDMTNPSLGITAQEDLERIESQAKGATIAFNVAPSGTALWWNLDYQPLKDVRVRRALTMLVDQKQLTIAGFGSERFRDFKSALFTSAYGLPTAETQKILGWDKPWDTRVTEAKRLLADAGYSDGFKLKMLVQVLPEQQRVLAALADVYRRNLNVNSEVAAVELVQSQKMRDAKDFGLYSWGPSAEPDDLMSFFVTGGVDNFLGYSNTRADALWAEQARTMDYAKRRQILQDIERLILTDVPLVPTGKYSYGAAWWPQVKNFKLTNHNWGPHLRMEQVWLDR